MPAQTPQQPEPLSAEKFSPPVFDAGLHLRRNLGMLGLTSDSDKFPRFTFIEAQAGQGKTTLVGQLIADCNAPVCWYRVETADRSPAYFLDSLLSGLSARLPGFLSTAVDALRSDELAPDQYRLLLDQALTDLDRSLNSRVILVLDDVHLCQDSAVTTALLQRLIENGPRQLHIVCISRHDLSPFVQVAKDIDSVVSLNNRALAFSGTEIAALFNTLLHVPLTRKAVHALQQTTDGWVMGLVLAGKSLEEDDPSSIEEKLVSMQSEREHIFDYLLEQVLNGLSAEGRELLLTLSLLDDIPLDLARSMTGRDEVADELADMVQSNRFIRVLNAERTWFALHHLFQDGIRQLALRERSAIEIRRLYGLAAAWYLKRQQPDRAIRYYIAGSDFDRAEEVLRQAGIDFKVQHRLTALRIVIGELPSGTVADHPWIAYYYGLGLMTENPPVALPLLMQALEHFVARSDELGELLASAQIILFSVATDGNYARGYPLFKRLMILSDRFTEELPPLLRGHVANVVVLANTFLHFDPEQAERFFASGLEIARREKLVSLEAEARMVRIHHLIFLGDWRRCRQELEAAQPLIDNPLVNQLHKVAMCLAYLSFFKVSGDFAAYERHKGRFRSYFDAQIRAGSVYDDYVLLWDLHVYLARGDRDSAHAVFQTAAASQGAAAAPHLKNMFLQFAALLAAEEGKRDEALALVAQARSLRETAGGDYFFDLNSGLFGATLDLLGEDDQALDCFAAALQSKSPYLRETALAFRARFYLRREKSAAAADDLQSLLGSMREVEHSNFYGWMPELVEELLSAAVRQGVEVSFARQLAMQRLERIVLDDGTMIPLLEVETLGSMRFHLGRQVFLKDTDLGESQRQLLAVLLSRSDLSCSQERLLSLLWPESDVKRARNNFDKLLSRVRQSFKAAFGAHGGHYLQLKNGILSLYNCRIDAHQFIREIKQGHGHFKQGNHWQAEICLHQAIELYRGEFLPSVTSNDQIETFRRELQQAYQFGVVTMAETLEQLQVPLQAISVLEKAIFIDPVHDKSVKKLYSLQILHGIPSTAQAVVEAYREALGIEGYSDQEVNDTLESFWT